MSTREEYIRDHLKSFDVAAQEAQRYKESPNTFGKALELIMGGAYVARKAWQHYPHNPRISMLTDRQSSCIQRSLVLVGGSGGHTKPPVQIVHGWMPTQEDLFATDWEIWVES